MISIDLQEFLRSHEPKIEFLRYAGGDLLPSPREAWSLLAKMGTKPASVFDLEDRDGVSQAWLWHFRECIIPGNHPEFYVSIGGYGGAPWALCRLRGPDTLPFSLSTHEGEPEFIVMCTDASMMLGITSEESEYFIFLCNPSKSEDKA